MKLFTIFIVSFVIVTFGGCNTAEDQGEQESKQAATSTDDSPIPKQTATTSAKEEQTAEIEAILKLVIDIPVAGIADRIVQIVVAKLDRFSFVIQMFN